MHNSSEKPGTRVEPDTETLESEDHISDADAGFMGDVLEFQLAGRSYCVDRNYVDEIFTLANLTPVPLAPAGLYGLTCLRGMIFPCVDIFGLLNDIPSPWHQAKMYGLRISVEQEPFAMIAWRIRGLFKVPNSEFVPEHKGLSIGYWMDQANAKQMVNVAAHTACRAVIESFPAVTLTVVPPASTAVTALPNSILAPASSATPASNVSSSRRVVVATRVSWPSTMSDRWLPNAISADRKRLCSAGSCSPPRSRSALYDRPPPHGFSRGNVAFSRTTTARPSSAARRAQLLPAGPAPTTIRSNVLLNSWLPLPEPGSGRPGLSTRPPS